MSFAILAAIIVCLCVVAVLLDIVTDPAKHYFVIPAFGAFLLLPIGFAMLHSAI